MTNFEGLYDIRDGKESDKNFVLATFLRGLYYGDSWFSMIPKDIFMLNYGKIAQNIMQNPNIIVKIACLKEDPDVILGYSLLSADQTAVVWVYVKSPWRKQGICTSLLPDSVSVCTHLTSFGKSLMHKRNLTFNPFV